MKSMQLKLFFRLFNGFISIVVLNPVDFEDRFRKWPTMTDFRRKHVCGSTIFCYDSYELWHYELKLFVMIFVITLFKIADKLSISAYEWMWMKHSYKLLELFQNENKFVHQRH